MIGNNEYNSRWFIYQIEASMVLRPKQRQTHPVGQISVIYNMCGHRKTKFGQNISRNTYGCRTLSKNKPSLILFHSCKPVGCVYLLYYSQQPINVLKGNTVWQNIFAPWCSEFNFRIQLLTSFNYNPVPQEWTTCTLPSTT